MKNNNIKVGTDFSGIGSPEQALTNLGIDYESVFACEIDKFALQSYSAIHKKPKTFYTDITKRDHSEVEQLDLYIAGFPCQTFSLAGNRKGFDDVRGTLFFDVADFIRTNKPKTFILENVKGLVSHDNGSTFQTIISLLTDNGGTANGQMSIPYFDDGLGYHVYYSVMNSKHHGVPQNRERIFIVGFRDFRTFTFPKREPLTKKLIDVLQDDVDDKYFLSDNWTGEFIKQEYNNMINKSTHNKISSCIDASYYKGFGVRNGICRQVVRVPSATLKGFEEAENGDSINLERLNSKTRRGRVGKQVAQTLNTDCSQGVLKDYKIRRLTPLECWRLQSFPDEQFKKAEAVCSDTQLYKQAGNSITVAVIQKLIKKILCL
jgi:DNA (cytosine-5)-methyltransferase 1